MSEVLNQEPSSILYPEETEQTTEQSEETTTEEESSETTEEATSEETESSEENQTKDEEDEGEQITSFSQLVEHMGWEPEWANSLKLSTKVDGESSETTIGDLVASHQMIEAAEKRLDDAKTRVQATNQELDQKSETMKSSLAQSAGLLQLAEKLFSLDAQEANLAKLREEGDDAKYLIAKDALTEQRRAIENVKQQAGELYQQAVTQLNAPPNKEALAAEQAKLFELIPGWKPKTSGSDAEKAEHLEHVATEKQDLVSYLTDTYQFTPEQIENTPDHRLFDMARKAMLFDKQQVKVQIAKKKVATIPKVMKVGSQEKESAQPRDHAEVLYGKQE